MTEQFLKGKRILLVEDDIYSIAIISATIERSGATVFTERVGDHIIQRVQSILPLDLILLDLLLPNDDGFQIFKTIHAQEKLAAIPILMISGTDDETAPDKARQLGLDGYIAKPISARALPGYLQVAIEGGEIWLTGE